MRSLYAKHYRVKLRRWGVHRIGGGLERVVSPISSLSEINRTDAADNNEKITAKIRNDLASARGDPDKVSVSISS